MYRILRIDPHSAPELEQMGSKEKSWISVSEQDDSKWLFKRPQRESSGEHWGEKIAAEVAGVLSIPCARVELAVLQEVRGSATENFVHGNHALIHGNEILERVISPFGADALNFTRSDHTLANIFLALDRTFENSQQILEAKLQFARYLVLDALVGNVDRHSQNWGIIQEQSLQHGVRSLAPSYDHGSSLGRELRDQERKRLLNENRVAEYSGRGRGGVYWDSSSGWGPSPVELVRLAFPKYPDFFRQAIAELDEVNIASLQQIIDRIPEDWMTPTARSFAIGIILHGRTRLQEIL